MVEESDILQIVEEDILRILAEKKEKTSLEVIKKEIKVSNSVLFQAIETLTRENLIVAAKDFFYLTEPGIEEAKVVLEKHLTLEKYFKGIRSEMEAHKMAHLLEHYFSWRAIQNIKKMSTLKGEGLPLTELELNRTGMVADILVFDEKLLERIISIGIFPGEKTEKTNEIHNGVIIKIGNKKIALDNSIAKRIKVLKNEST